VIEKNNVLILVRAALMRTGWRVAASAATALLAAAVALAPAQAQFNQQSKLVGTGAQGVANQGWSVALSADGNTALVGGPADNASLGAAWVYTRTGGIWSQQGVKLTPVGEVTAGVLGFSVALSSDGNTAVIGAPHDNGNTGGVFIFVRSNGVWTQQGQKLVPGGSTTNNYVGYSVAISGDGNTVLVGAPGYNMNNGAAYIYQRFGTLWLQQSNRLFGTGTMGTVPINQGDSVALSTDASTALVGGAYDSSGIGAGWIFVLSAGNYIQQAKLVGSGYADVPGCSDPHCVGQGASAALSANGNVAALGAPFDNGAAGAVWVFTRAGTTWSQAGSKLVGSGALGVAHQGFSVALSSDGSLLTEGGWSDNSDTGAVWLFANLVQQGSKAVGGGAIPPSWQGISVALDSGGDTALVGGPADAGGAGAAWAFTTAPVTPPTPLGFYPMTPCRAVDTRSGHGTTGAYGPPALVGGVTRNFDLALSNCDLPTTAQAFSLNFTAVPSGPLGFLSTWPTGESYPGVSTLNSTDGETVAAAAIVGSGTTNSISVLPSQNTDLIIDANGYFAPPSGPSLVFFPLTPCRVVDTRTSQNKTGAFGPPSMAANTTRTFPLTSDDCGIPASAQAYALNITAVPQGPLPYLSIWPDSVNYPNVSTLNSPNGNTIANAAIVPAGNDGGVTVLAGGTTDVIIDINGYFGVSSMANPGLHFYAVTPCRVADTRSDQGRTGAFGPPSLVANATRDFPIQASSCNIPGTAQAYSLNFTVVPPGPLQYLSAWPSGQPFPVVSTLNSPAGLTLANAAIIPAGQSGNITVLASDTTDLIIDINGYFAP